ncbi:MAG: aminoacetone oxidase family FAD-binding enzyme [Oscillospiraceae bacterium]|nr:aminoacetone oxidase family FAD-binding enzyme [Oscillospiraceae bacterium]
MNTVVVIGGGASGIMAALTAAENKDNRVILLERQQRIGRKLLATGNGRCNLTNTGAAPGNYHGEQADFARPALARFSPQDALAFFHGLGLLTEEEYGGRVYPLSNSANSVLDVLRFALEKAGVDLRCACPARRILRRNGGGYTVVTDAGETDADALIVACGGAAGAKLGGVTDGYELLKPLGHKRTPLRPALTQILTAPDYPRALKGVRAAAVLRLTDGETALGENRGELQFTETGVSGPAAFDLSRAVAAGGEGLSLCADFLPEGADAFALLEKRRETFPGQPASELFTGMLHNRLGRMLVKYAGLEAARPIGSLTDNELRRAARACTAFTLPVRGVEGFDSAQVTAGGVRTAGFNPDTLESWFMPGLFVCGELLDIDGDCGGYNLQWAWASGRLAGRLGT